MERTQPVLEYARLDRERDALRARFAAGDPIRHVVIDDLFEPAVARQAARGFPDPQAMQIAFAGLPEVKNAEQRLDAVDPVYRTIFDELRSERFLTWLGTVTSTEGLVADPELHGGGLHQGSDGSYLDVHADFNIHPQLGLYRRLNVLVYLNERWELPWQGYLELWSRDMSECRASIEPRFNRCVIMETHDHAFHGYKELRLPPGVTRRSLAAYYYSGERSGAQTPEAHNTLFQLRPEQRPASGARLFFRRLAALAPPAVRPIVRGLRSLLRLD
jgi:hypothetical protein